MALYVKRPRETFSEVMKDPGREPPPIGIPPPFGRRDDISRGRELVLSSRTSAVTKVSRRPNGRFFRSSRSLTLRNAVTKGPYVGPPLNRRLPPIRIPPPFGRRDDISRRRALALSSRTSVARR